METDSLAHTCPPQKGLKYGTNRAKLVDCFSNWCNALAASNLFLVNEVIDLFEWLRYDGRGPNFRVFQHQDAVDFTSCAPTLFIDSIKGHGGRKDCYECEKAFEF